MSTEEFQNFVTESLNTLQSQQREILAMLAKPPSKKFRKKQLTETQKAILAHGAVTIKGCETISAVAKELGISRSTAHKSPGIRRVLNLNVVDRSNRRGFVNSDGQVEPYENACE